MKLELANVIFKKRIEKSNFILIEELEEWVHVQSNILRSESKRE